MRVVVFALGLLLGATPAVADDALWALLKGGGQAVMIRHATAPGAYDPPGMRFDDCATQRNLDEQGRDEARRIGAAFRARAIPVDKVLDTFDVVGRLAPSALTAVQGPLTDAVAWK